MSIEKHHILVSGLRVEIVRKDIKNLHLGVYPPNGRVRVAVPLAVSDDAVRLAVIGKLAWIRKKRSGFEDQARQSLREMVNGETHYFLGQRYRLSVQVKPGNSRVEIRNKKTITLFVRPEATAEQREHVLNDWYRKNLKTLIPPLLEKWQPVLGVVAADWGVKKMKTMWGACNPDDKRIWLNLELAKKDARCLEYILVHELIHLLERHHNDRFQALMDHHLPHWRSIRSELNDSVLGHEDWEY
jgi:hypothetical protein